MTENIAGLVDSFELATAFDNLSKGKFYYRDWTKDSFPVVNKNEVYWSEFYFQYFQDAQKFLNLFKINAVGNWMKEYKEFNKKCNEKRNNK